MANAKAALDTLRDYEKRSLIHAVGLPEQVAAQGLWVGIAYRLEGASLVSQLDQVVEIMPVPAVTSVPGAKFWMLGVANVRGNLVPIVDLRGYLNGDKTQIGRSTRVLVAIQQDSVVGLLVDEIVGQRQFERDEQVAGGYYQKHIVGDYIGKEFTKDEQHWAELDLDRLVNSQEFLQAAA